MLREIDARPTPGIPIALLLDAAVIGGGFLVIMGARLGNGALAAGGGLLASLSLLSLSGLFAVSPNEAKVLTLFGNYKGTAKAPGLWFINPFMSKKTVYRCDRGLEGDRHGRSGVRGERLRAVRDDAK